MKKSKIKVIIIIILCILLLVCLFSMKYIQIKYESKKSDFKIANINISNNKSLNKQNKLDSNINYGINEKKEKRKDSSNINKISNSSSSPTYSSAIFDEPIIRQATISKKQIKANEAFKAKAILRQKALRDEMIEKDLKDPTTPPLIKLRAQLIKSESYSSAYKAFKEKNYIDAIKKYNDVLKDSKSTPAVKYIALQGLQNCAKLTNNLELYILACKETGLLLSKEDLTVINKRKTNDFLDWANEFADYMHARKDSNIKNKLISQIQNQNNWNSKEAEDYVNKQIEKYEYLFKEFI